MEAAQRHGVDPGFAVAIVAAESDFDRDRNSPKGARGPMQLMPATAARFGVSDLCEPAANIDAGVRYLRTASRRVQAIRLLAAAAYNAGEDRIYEYGGIPPFPETVSYVAKVVNHQLGCRCLAGEEREGRSARRRTTWPTRRRRAKKASALGRRRDAVLEEAFTGEHSHASRYLNQHRRSQRRILTDRRLSAAIISAR